VSVDSEEVRRMMSRLFQVAGPDTAKSRRPEVWIIHWEVLYSFWLFNRICWMTVVGNWFMFLYCSIGRDGGVQLWLDLHDRWIPSRYRAGGCYPTGRTVPRSDIRTCLFGLPRRVCTVQSHEVRYRGLRDFKFFEFLKFSKNLRISTNFKLPPNFKNITCCDELENKIESFLDLQLQTKLKLEESNIIVGPLTRVLSNKLPLQMSTVNDVNNNNNNINNINNNRLVYSAVIS